MTPRLEFLPEEKMDRKILALALLILLASGYWLFIYTSEFPPSFGLPQIGTMRMNSSIRVRHAKSLRWQTSKQEEMPIYLKDMVYTPKDTTAEFIWNNKKFILEPESLVQFDEALFDKLEITLLDGKIRTDAESANLFKVTKLEPKTVLFKKQEISFLPDLNGLIIRQAEASSRTQEKLAKKIQVDPMRAIIVPKLYLNKLSDYQIVLKSPQNQTYRYRGSDWIEFQWNEIPLEGVEFNLFVSTRNDFEKKVQTKVAQGPSQILFEAPGNYWWKVVAARRIETIESEAVNFTLSENEGTSLPARSLTSEKEPQTESQKKKRQKTPFQIIFGK